MCVCVTRRPRCLVDATLQDGDNEGGRERWLSKEGDTFF